MATGDVTGGESAAVAEERDWSEMTPVCLAEAFSRLGLEDVWRGAMAVRRRRPPGALRRARPRARLRVLRRRRRRVVEARLPAPRRRHAPVRLLARRGGAQGGPRPALLRRRPRLRRRKVQTCKILYVLFFFFWK